MKPGLGLLACLLALTPRLAAASDEVIALMPLTSMGSTADAAQAVERVLTGELHKLLGERLRPAATLEAQGDHAKRALVECDGAPACLAELVGALGWDAFIVGNVTGLGEQRVIQVRLIGARDGKERGRQQVQASGEEKQLIVQIRRAIVQLVAPDLYVGSLEITAMQPGVRILLDGELLATTPLASPRFGVPVGRHSVEASGEGLVPFSDFVDVAYDETKRITIDLPINTVFVGGSTPFHSRWWTWALAGAGALGTGLGGYFNYLHTERVQRIEELAAQDKLNAETGSLYAEESGHWSRALVFYGVGGALLGGVVVLLTVDML